MHAEAFHPATCLRALIIGMQTLADWIRQSQIAWQYECRTSLCSWQKGWV